MKCLVWNVRGMNASTKRLGIKKVCKDHQAKLVCLLETKVKVDNCGAIFDNFILDWKYVHNGEIDNTIRIWLGSDPSFFNVEEIQKTKQFIHAKVSIMGTAGSFLCTIVYALNTVVGQKDLWEDVGSLASAIATLWAILGDFNVIRNHNEKIGGDPVRFEAIDDFNTFIEDSGLIDLKWKGEAMTWNNRQSGDARIRCKLDRVMVNLAWMDVFITSEAIFHPPGLSDHSPVVVVVLDEVNFDPKPFWQNRKHILEIKGEGGEIVKDPSQIKDEAVSFYKKLFGSDSVDGGCFPNSVPLQNGLFDSSSEMVLQ
ncbi:uncharacterized protein LOC122647653 [Telopea speciosissima]|uniref:uncharacterized protein LOC122647653 n=1 Tax=Telopea speciosissima TaxID=54955 RepID=UPI001CC7B8C7|nr:uncharacterized protein LOC122647653 [Telopea speciosissima]